MIQLNRQDLYWQNGQYTFMQIDASEDLTYLYNEHFLTLLIAGQPTTTIYKWTKIKNTKRKVKFTSTGKCKILDTKAVESYQIIS